MKHIGWAIALAAAWLTPAAAQAPQGSSANSTPAAAAPAPGDRTRPEALPKGSVPTPPAGFDQSPSNPSPATASPAQEPLELAPTPGIGQPDGRMGLQNQVTPVGREALAFHDSWLIWLCAIICAIVLALLLYAMVRFRRSANPTPSRNSHNTTIEVIWTLVPVLILVLIAIPSIRLERHQYSPPPADVTVKVTGHQWYWSYEYPDYGVTFDSYMLKEKNDPTRQANQRFRTAADGPPLLAVDERIVIPEGKVVKFLVTADDVIHSFAVPAFWIKQDANPGQVHEAWAKVDRPGVYFGQCSELCGARHAFMPIAVQVVPQAQFAQWVALKNGHMPSSGAPAGGVSAAAKAGAGMTTPAPAVPGSAAANTAPAPTNPDAANRANQ